MFNWKHSFHNNLKVYPTRDVSLRDDAEGPPSVFFYIYDAPSLSGIYNNDRT